MSNEITKALAGRYFNILTNEGLAADQANEWIEAEITNRIGEKGNLPKIFLTFTDAELLTYYRSHKEIGDD